MKDQGGPRFRDLGSVTFDGDGPVATITLNDPETANAQSYRMLDELDRAFEEARGAEDVRVVILRGAGGNFSSGHELPAGFGVDEGPEELYAQFRRHNIELLMKWREIPKPTIALVEGYCIYGGWMLAAAMDLVFAARDAQFLGGYVQYNSIPWDLGFRKAKDVCFESRFLSGEECAQAGFASRVFAAAEIEAETYAYARRVAENDPFTLRMAKLQINKAQDAQGFRSALEDSFGDYLGMIFMPGLGLVAPGGKGRLKTVDLAIRGRKGERPGATG
ncbi:MAG: enoyl-CoA hydratase/isomerase family protein [Actinobacteria bacterium]|nr:enoyl-CoA hydratase/isomerase family protein [Actinomycetota bacterium]